MTIGDPRLGRAGLVFTPGGGEGDVLRGGRASCSRSCALTPEGDQIEEDHQRNRPLIAQDIMDKTGAIELVTKRDGKRYVVVKDSHGCARASDAPREYADQGGRLRGIKALMTVRRALRPEAC